MENGWIDVGFWVGPEGRVSEVEILRQGADSSWSRPLLDAIGGENAEAFDRSIDAHVKNIRRKLEPNPHRPRYVLTVYGVGYKCAE